MSTALTLLKQLLSKGGKIVLKGIKLAGANAGKFINMAKTFAAKNPELAAWIATQTIDLTIDKVKDYMTEHKIQADGVVSALEAMEAIAGAIAIEKVAGGKKPSNNMPKDWFNDGTKVSAVSEANAPANRVPNADRWVARHFYVTKATSVSGTNFLYEPTVSGFYEAYNSWYNKYKNLQPADYTLKTKEQVEADLTKIFRNSWVAISILNEMWRSQSAAEIAVNQRKGFGRAVCGPNAFAFSFQTQNESIKNEIHNKGNIAGLTPGTRTAFGDVKSCRVESKSTSLLSYTETRFKYGLPSISNKEWSDMIAKAKSTLILSDNAYNMSRYLFSQVFTDYSGEDDMEFYTFHAPLYAGEIASDAYIDGALDLSLTGPTPVTSVSSFLQAFYRACSIVEETYDSDPAYSTILTMMGYKAESSDISTGVGTTWRSKLAEDCKRDISGKTLIVKEADDELYLALLNANYYVKTEAYNQTVENGPFQMEPDVVCLKNYSAYADSTVRPDKIAFGTLPKLPIESLTENASKDKIEIVLNAGEVAAATKFCSVMALVLGPVIVFDGNGAPAIGNPTNCDLPFDKGFSEYQINRSDFTADTIRVAKFGILPCGIAPYFTANENTYIIGGYKRDNWGYDMMSSHNFKTLEDIQWTNLLLGKQTFEEVIKTLSVIKNFNSLNNG